MDHVLQIIRLKGRATLPALLAAVQADPRAALAELTAVGLVERTLPVLSGRTRTNKTEAVTVR